jgi:glycosyltransferase involved in cell wall biosynthesis
VEHPLPNRRAARRPLRILAVGSSASPHIVNRVRCFAERGHQVCLLCEREMGLSPIAELVPAAPPGQDEWVTRAVHGVERLLHRKLDGAADMLRLMLDFRRLVQRAAPDIVHVHYAYATWGWMTAALGLRPLVVSIMGGDVLYDEQGSPNRRGIRLTMRLLGAADLITAKSNFLIEVLDSLGGYGSKAIRVIWGIDPEQFKPLDRGVRRAELGVPADAKVILSPRILAPFYNIDVLIDAMARVVASEPKARLLLTEFGATAEYRGALQAQIEALNLTGRVQFIGAFPQNRMPELYALADISVGIPKSDGLPQTLLEGMACGVPTVVGQLARYSEIVRDGESAVFAEITPAGVADAIVSLLKDPALHGKISRTGREIVAEHASFPRDVDRVESAYYALLDRWRPPRLPRPQMLSDAALYWLGR